MSTQTIESSAAAGVQAAPPNELALMNPLSPTVQQVLDETGIGSALYLGTTRVGVGTATPGFPFVVESEPVDNAIAQLRARGIESSLEFVNTQDNARWRIGTGGGAGEKAFFLWSMADGIVLTVVNKTFHFSGSVKVDDLALPNLSPISAAPAGANLESVVVDTKTGKLYFL